MRILRGNTLPDYTLLSSNASGAKKDSYKGHERWMYQPIMDVNVDDVDVADIEQLSQDKVNLFDRQYAGVRLKPSMYNIQKPYSDGTVLVINTLYESIVSLSDVEASKIKPCEINETSPKTIMQLYLLGLLVFEEDDETIKLKIIRSRSAFAPGDAANFVIYPTQACNARCHYCFEDGIVESLSMSSSVAQETVNFIQRNIAPSDEVVFRWFGGEPLLASDTITFVCDQVSRMYDGSVEFSSNVTTNGYRIDDDLIRTAKEIWHARKFNLTLDGYGKEHNLRKNYKNVSGDPYKKILGDIEKLIDAGIFVVCRLNMDKLNLNNFESMLDDLDRFKNEEMFFLHNTTLRCPRWDDPNNYILPKDYADAYEYTYSQLFSRGFYSDIKHIFPLRMRGNCLARLLNEIIIGSDGYLYKCEQLPASPDFAVGHVSTGAVLNPVYEEWLDVDIKRDGCKKCVYLPLCGGGCRQYWEENRPGIISPCAREKDYIGTILDLVHEWVVHGFIRARSLEDAFEGKAC